MRRLNFFLPACSGLAAIIAVASAWLVAPPFVARAQTLPGDTITIVSGFTHGGGDAQGGSARQGGASQLRPQPVYDLTARLYIRHIGRFLPGMTKVNLKLMPGAGSLRAARWLYRDAKADGTIVGALSGRALRRMIFARELKHDRHFTAIGGRIAGEYICVRKLRSGAANSKVLFGATAPGERSFVHARAIHGAKMANAKLIAGYSNSVELALALRRGEIEGFCGIGAAAIRSQLGDLIASGALLPAVRFAPPGRGIMRQVPRASQKVVAALGLQNSGAIRKAIEFLEYQAMIDFALLAPPDVSAPQAELLRDAFARMIGDPEFRREAVRWGLEVNPVTPQEMNDAFKSMGRLAKIAQPQIKQWSSTDRRP